MNTQHTAGGTLPSRWETVPSPLQDGEPSEQGPSHCEVRDPLTLVSHCQAGHLCSELLGRGEAITEDNEALKYALSPLLGAVGLRGCHCPSQSRVSLPVPKESVLQGHHEGACCDQMCEKWQKLPGPLHEAQQTLLY